MRIPLDRVGLLTDGIYRIRITESEDRTSSAGNPYVNLTCDVLDENGRSMDTTIWNSLSMSPKAKFMVSKFLDAIGAPMEGNLSSRSLKGKSFWASVGRETYQGKTKNVILDYLTPEQARKDPSSIQNVFSLDGAVDDNSNGFDAEDSIESWDDDESLASLPEEMSETEDSRF
jgi:hypothetical protein